MGNEPISPSASHITGNSKIIGRNSVSHLELYHLPPGRGAIELIALFTLHKVVEAGIISWLDEWW